MCLLRYMLIIRPIWPDVFQPSGVKVLTLAWWCGLFYSFPWQDYPLPLLVEDVKKSASFILFSSMIFLVSMSGLLFIFIPKIIRFRKSDKKSFPGQAKIAGLARNHNGAQSSGGGAPFVSVRFKWYLGFEIIDIFLIYHDSHCTRALWRPLPPLKP